LEHGKGYQYSHDFKENISGQDFIPASKKYYQPKENGYEKTVKERLDYWASLKKDLKKDSS